MSQLPLFVLIHLLGVAIALAVGPRRWPALCCALGFPVGLVAIVLVDYLLLLLPVALPAWAIAAAALVAAIGFATLALRAGLPRGALALVVAWTAGFALLAAAACLAVVVVMTHDSHTLVMMARVIAEDGTLSSDVIAQLDEWGSFQVVAQSLVGLTRQDFLYALPLTFGLTSIPLFAVTLWHALAAAGADRRRRATFVALVVLATFSIHMVGFHAAYLHTNYGSAVYLLGFVVLVWLAEVEGDPRLLPPAFLFLIALALQRTETPIVALLFLALTAAQSRLPRRTVTGWIAAFVAVVVLWFEVLAWNVAEGGAFLTPARCRFVQGLFLAVLAYRWLGGRVDLRRVDDRLPLVVAGLTAVALIGAFATRTEHMALSAQNFAGALTQVPSWGPTAAVVVALALLGLAAPAPAFRQAFVVGIPVFLAFVLLLALGRSPYSNRIDDSANRMAIHVVPLVFWYLGLKLGLALLPRVTARGVA